MGPPLGDVPISLPIPFPSDDGPSYSSVTRLYVEHVQRGVQDRLAASLAQTVLSFLLISFHGKPYFEMKRN